MTIKGDVVSRSPLADAFLFGWTTDDANLICYRDSHFLLVGLNGDIVRRATQTTGEAGPIPTERVAYLSKADTFVWVEHHRSARTILMTNRGGIADKSMLTGDIVVPSPDERFVAVAGNGMDLWVYDTVEKTWVNLGKVSIHPDTAEWGLHQTKLEPLVFGQLAADLLFRGVTGRSVGGWAKPDNSQSRPQPGWPCNCLT